MELNKLKKEAKELMGRGNTKKVFNLLALVSEDSDKSSELILLRGRYNRLKDKEKGGRLDPNTYEIQLNNITSTLIDFVTSLEAEDIKMGFQVAHQEITNRIIVFTQAAKIESISQLFAELNFSNVSVLTANKLTDTELKDVDLIVFDNTDLPVCYNEKQLEGFEVAKKTLVKARIVQMDEIINNTPKFIVHYGNILHWVNDKRARVQAANAQFTLYARIKEVIEFINTYRV